MAPQDSPGAAPIPRIQMFIALLWPGFLVAGVATVLVFTLIDPVEVMECMGWSGLDRLGLYSLGFFFFWVLSSGSSAATCYFQKPCATVNRKPAARS